MAMRKCNNSRINTMKNHRVQFYLKGSHIVVSIILIAVAILLFLGSIIIRINIVLYKRYLEFHISKPLLLLLFGSILLIATGFLGILSVIHNWCAGMKTFAFFLFSLLISMIALCVIFYHTSQTADDAMRSRLIEHVENYSLYWQSVDDIQRKLSCCGVDDFTDWNRTLHFIPGSCCESNTSCGIGDVMNLHHDGCYKALMKLLNYGTERAIVVLAILASIEIVSIVLSLLFIRILRRKKQFGRREIVGNNNCDEPIQIPRLNMNPLEQGISPDTTSNSSSVFESPPVEKYNISMGNYVRRPIEHNFSANYRNPHEFYLRSPPKHRYDRRLRHSSTKRINIHVTDSQK